MWKVLRLLSDAGLVQSVSGPYGGCRLARPLRHITLLEVVEAIDGPIWGEALPVHAGDGAALDRRLQALCDRLAEGTGRQLRRVRLSQLAEP
jgi:DNA-binding IscR family transcriptional regulator